MDKASIIKDAIEYIQVLQAEERQMAAEVSALESSAAGAEDDRDDPLPQGSDRDPQPRPPGSDLRGGADCV
jgi:hypothetical protein